MGICPATYIQKRTDKKKHLPPRGRGGSYTINRKTEPPIQGWAPGSRGSVWCATDLTRAHTPHTESILCRWLLLLLLHVSTSQHRCWVVYPSDGALAWLGRVVQGPGTAYFKCVSHRTSCCYLLLLQIRVWSTRKYSMVPAVFAVLFPTQTTGQHELPSSYSSSERLQRFRRCAAVHPWDLPQRHLSWAVMWARTPLLL